MSNEYPDVEITDYRGSTFHYNGTANTTPASVPPSPGNYISDVLVRCEPDQSSSRNLYVSFEATPVDFISLHPGDVLSWSPKELRQLTIKAGPSICNYQLIINFEELV